MCCCACFVDTGQAPHTPPPRGLLPQWTLLRAQCAPRTPHVHFPHLEIRANVILNVPVFAARRGARSCTRAFPVALVSCVMDLPLKRAVFHAVTNRAASHQHCTGAVFACSSACPARARLVSGVDPALPFIVATLRFYVRPCIFVRCYWCTAVLISRVNALCLDEILSHCRRTRKACLPLS